MAVENLWGEAEAVSLNVRRRVSHSAMFWGVSCRRAWIPCGRAEAGNNRKISDFRNGHSRRQQACLVLLIAESHFLDGFVDDMGDRIVSDVTVSRVWADCNMITKAIEDLTAQGAL